MKHTEPSLLVNTQEFLPSDKKEIPVISQTLLIVEDNKDVLEYLEKQFENEYKVQKAENGQEALKQIAIKLPDLIISDIMMPEMDGLELWGGRLYHQTVRHRATASPGTQPTGFPQADS